MGDSKIAIVTGANKGIGLAIGEPTVCFSSTSVVGILTPLTVRNLALQYPKSSLNTGPLLIYLTARSSTRGEEAVKTLLTDPQLKAAKALSQDGGLSTITFGHLDIIDGTSIRDFKELVKKGHPNGIDILVNNAGIYMDASGKICKRLSHVSHEI